MFNPFLKFSDALMTVPFYGDNGLMYKIYDYGITFWKKYLPVFSCILCISMLPALLYVRKRVSETRMKRVVLKSKHKEYLRGCLHHNVRELSIIFTANVKE